MLKSGFVDDNPLEHIRRDVHAVNSDFLFLRGVHRFYDYEKPIGTSGRSPTNKLSIVKQRVRVHGRRLSWLLGWHRSVDRSVLGCVLRASAGVAERRRAGV